MFSFEPIVYNLLIKYNCKKIIIALILSSLINLWNAILIHHVFTV
jgi:hypothetical protein